MRTRLTTIFAATALMLLTASCFSGGGILGSPLFILNFREGSSFPHAQPSDDVLLIDVAASADFPVSAKLSIDDVLVQTVAITQDGRTELAFPPAAWVEVDGEHELEVSIGDVERTQPFSWN